MQYEETFEHRIADQLPCYYYGPADRCTYPLDDLQHMVEALRQTMDAIPAEILAMYKEPQITEKGEINRE